MSAFEIVAQVTLVAFITIGNLLVLISYIRYQHTFDISRYQPSTIDNQHSDQFCDFVFSVHCVFAGVTFHHLMTISIDRYIKITRNFYYRKTMTSRKARIFVLIMYILNARVCLPNILLMEHKYNFEHGCEYYTPIIESYSTMISTSIILISVNIVPAIFLIVCNLKLYLIAINFKSAIASQLKQNGMENKMVVLYYNSGRVVVNSANSHDEQSQGSMSNNTLTGGRSWSADTNCSKARKLKDMMSVAIKQRKAALMIGMIITAFCVCWPPSLIVWFVQSFFPHELPLPAWTLPVWPWLGYLNSAFNPIILYTMSDEYRRAFRQCLSPCQKRRMNI